MVGAGHPAAGAPQPADTLRKSRPQRRSQRRLVGSRVRADEAAATDATAAATDGAKLAQRTRPGHSSGLLRALHGGPLQRTED